ncbi:MAG: hypothetical protein H0V33_09975 [Acidimicrobiia bacterium]|nr:hypothetical protein [Acidimicrobiia bacterium]
MLRLPLARRGSSSDSSLDVSARLPFWVCSPDLAPLGRVVPAHTTRFPCPCCGHVVFEEEPGSDEICPVCFWQDDIANRRGRDAGTARLGTTRPGRWPPPRSR